MLLVLCCLLVHTFLAGAASAEPKCTFVSYDKAARKLKVNVEGVPDKKRVFVAAVLDRGSEGGLWVQAGREIGKSGEAELEAYDFEGKAFVYAAKSAAGRTFLEAAQKRAAKGKSTAAKAASKAAIEPICEFDVP